MFWKRGRYAVSTDWGQYLFGFNYYRDIGLNIFVGPVLFTYWKNEFLMTLHR
jgi:hypothetical protein